MYHFYKSTFYGFINQVESHITLGKYNRKCKVTVTPEAWKFVKTLFCPIGLDRRCVRAYIEKLEEASMNARYMDVDRIRITTKNPRGIQPEDYTESYTWFTVYENEKMDIWVLKDPGEVCKLM